MWFRTGWYTKPLYGLSQVSNQEADLTKPKMWFVQILASTTNGASVIGVCVPLQKEPVINKRQLHILLILVSKLAACY